MTSTPDVLPRGYPKLAEKMGLQPQTAIFRRFGFLNKLNLLYLQAELVEIEDELKSQQINDNSLDSSGDSFARYWPALRESVHTVNKRQFELVKRAQEMLERYNTAMIQQSRILSMRFPDKMDMDDIKGYIWSEDMGHCNPFTGADAYIWGADEREDEMAQPHAPDIITPFPIEQKDVFARILNKKFFDLRLNRILGHLDVNGLKLWEDETLDRLSFVVSTAVASILPVISIIILYYVESMKARFGIMMAFNILISFCLGFLTRATRSEIFAVTAAFSAIQVVFVQSNNGPQTTTA